jgi:hypothetical protein
MVGVIHELPLPILIDYLAKTAGNPHTKRSVMVWDERLVRRRDVRGGSFPLEARLEFHPSIIKGSVAEK